MLYLKGILLRHLLLTAKNHFILQHKPESPKHQVMSDFLVCKNGCKSHLAIIE